MAETSTSSGGLSSAGVDLSCKSSSDATSSSVVNVQYHVNDVRWM